MKLSIVSALFSADIWLFERPEADQTTFVVGGASADLTQSGTYDPLQQADELPEDRRGMGFTQ